MSSVALKLQTTKTSNATRSLVLASHTLRALLEAGANGRRMDLAALCERLGVDDAAPERDGVRARRLRREDVRAIVRQLDVEGFVDASRMRLTLAGFALARTLAPRRLASR